MIDRQTGTDDRQTDRQGQMIDRQRDRQTGTDDRQTDRQGQMIDR